MHAYYKHGVKEREERIQRQKEQKGRKKERKKEKKGLTGWLDDFDGYRSDVVERQRCVGEKRG